MERVSWSVQPTGSPPLRRLTYAVFGLFGGLVGLVGVILVGLGFQRLSDGDFRLLLLLIVLAAIGVLLAALYVLPGLRNPDRRPAALAIEVERLDRQWLAVSSLAGAAALWFLSQVSPVAPLAALAVGAIALVALLGAAHNEGAIDPEAGTLTYRDREIDLRDVAGVSAAVLGPAAVLVLSYRTGARGPRLLVLPATVATVLRESVGDGVAE